MLLIYVSFLSLDRPQSEVAADGHGFGVFGAADPLADRQQGRELVTRPGWVPGIPGPQGEVALDY
jgi:hypothetical protein